MSHRNYWIPIALGWLAACQQASEPQVHYTEERAVCADRNPQRNLYWGDLHGHGALSFDAWSYGTHAGPADFYRFARGEALSKAGGSVQLQRPLDFAALTDHQEFIGELDLCLTEGSPTHDVPTCVDYRQGDMGNVVDFGMRLARSVPVRFEDVCDPDRVSCLDVAGQVWERIIAAAEDAYDRTESCGFTSFIAYEYTNAVSVTNLHRNVIFRNNEVPLLPPSYFEQPTVPGLWRDLDESCLKAGNNCDVLVIPHNSNWSNGKLFHPDALGAVTPAARRDLAFLRARMEPLAEIFQHKGDMECDPNLDGEPLCDFEKQRLPPFEDCGDGTGSGGVSLMGCVSRLDFLRNVLKRGLSEKASLGINPYRLGLVASTDTHNATPGFVDETRFQGHVGSTDDTPLKRLGFGNMTHHGVRYNPGGLAAVWALENSRDALFEAFRRREVYGTSGPRIEVRLFAGWDLPDDLCDAARPEKTGYDKGVPMGGELPDRPGEAELRLAVWAVNDPLSAAGLQRIQVVKGWLDATGVTHEQVLDVAGDPGDGAGLDLSTCQPDDPGVQRLCAVWRDPDFDPAEPAFYYARVLQAPTCRWSVRECNALDAADRPASCSDPAYYRAIQERAWTSPVWFDPS